MSMQDPVADMLTCIRNAQAMGIVKIKFPFSNLKNEILRVMKEEGYIVDAEMLSEGNKKYAQVTLKYYQGIPVVAKIKRVSRPGLRIYKACKELPLVKGGLGIAVVSTPKGIMTERSARSHQVGGEILCTIE